MRIRLLFFASVRDIAGEKEIDWNLPERLTVGGFKEKLIVRYPALKELMKSLSVAVNAEYADDSVILQAGDEVAIIPPVSGG